MPDTGSRTGCLCPPTRTERTTLGLVVVDTRGSRDHGVEQRGQVVERGGAEMRLVDRHVAPGHDLEALRGACVDDLVLRALTSVAVAAIEEGGDDADALGVDRGAGRSREGSEELARQREEHAGSVTGEPVGRDRTAVADAGEPRERQLHDLTARAAALVGDEPDPAGVELGTGAVGTTRRRRRGARWSRTRNKRQLGLPGS
jgi:hypothetical protein